MTRLIDADDLKKTIAEFHKEENERLHNPLWDSIGLNALNRIIDNAPTVDIDLAEYSNKLWKEAYERGKNERPQGNCKNCKAYRQYGSRADGYCDISRMTAEGMLHINVNEDFYCSYFEEADNGS